MKYFAKTDQGKERQTNQDYVIAENHKIGIFNNIFIVADGVGSSRESGYASKHCSDFVIEQLALSHDTIDYKEELKKAFTLANIDLVYRIMANTKYQSMGTTMVLTTIFDNHAIVASVGDSRLYHIRDGLKQVTVDHTIAEELVKENVIDRNSDKYKELKSQLSRAFGQSKKISVDLFDVYLQEGDFLLLCSDGLYNMVSNQKIFEIVSNNKTLEEKVTELIDLANENGGKDNISIILIYIDKLVNKKPMPFNKKMSNVFNQDSGIATNSYNQPDNNQKDLNDNKDNIDGDNSNISLIEILRRHKNTVNDGFRSRKKKEADDE